MGDRKSHLFDWNCPECQFEHFIDGDGKPVPFLGIREQDVEVGTMVSIDKFGEVMRDRELQVMFLCKQCGFEEEKKPFGWSMG